ncbi:MAG TPA: hypothetical protein IGS53_07015 [Leptolyngbyaceae cyanobacterium M33_DOE_097]|uniref:Uncharacterized protein n=1 Tax=Oscillatoriales cyanobacterium SpSt-418 TaxID=2282169 RepID=A0A7C3KIH3_9CYAN|nr:hypothetical protein [Leptolyngbyaceae cyanobacterium M33_DOE_097]
MPTDLWQSIQSLLLLCAFEDSSAVQQLAPVIQVLRQNLPNANLLVLNRLEQGFELINHDSLTEQIKPSAFYPCTSDRDLVAWLHDHSFDAAIIFTRPSQSPYALAYLCYLAGIRIRLGQSREFGGGVLSPCVTPKANPVTVVAHHLHLLTSAGFSYTESTEAAIAH